MTGIRSNVTREKIIALISLFLGHLDPQWFVKVGVNLPQRFFCQRLSPTTVAYHPDNSSLDPTSIGLSSLLHQDNNWAPYFPIAEELTNFFSPRIGNKWSDLVHGLFMGSRSPFRWLDTLANSIIITTTTIQLLGIWQRRRRTTTSSKDESPRIREWPRVLQLQTRKFRVFYLSTDSDRSQSSVRCDHSSVLYCWRI